MKDSARFDRRARLLKPAEYKRVFDSAKRSSDRYLTILCSPNDLDHARLGLAISKKCSKLAVQRNRIKRLIRETFRLNQHDLLQADYVVMARPVAAKADNQELIRALNKLRQKVSEKCAASLKD